MEIASLLSSARIAYDLAKGIASLKGEVERNQAISKILEVLIAVQADALSMQEKHSLLTMKVQDLENECLRLKDWSAEKQRYSAREIAPGVFAYVGNDVVSGFQGTHKLCTNCFEQGYKSLLQQSLEEKRHISLSCPRCKTKIEFHDTGYLA